MSEEQQKNLKHTEDIQALVSVTFMKMRENIK